MKNQPVVLSVNEWRGGEKSRVVFVVVDHIVAMTDNMYTFAEYPEQLKTRVLLSTGDDVVTMEPLGELLTRFGELV